MDDPGAIVAVTGAMDGLDVRHCGPALFVSWEDERAEIGRRLSQLGADKLIDVKGIAGQFRYVDARTEGPLWAQSPDGPRYSAELTPCGRKVRATCERMGARLLVVDSLAGAYAGDENARHLVRAFCANWDAWASASRCAAVSSDARAVDAPPPLASAENAGGRRSSRGRCRLLGLDRLAQRGALAVVAGTGTDRRARGTGGGLQTARGERRRSGAPAGESELRAGERADLPRRVGDADRVAWVLDRIRDPREKRGKWQNASERRARRARVRSARNLIRRRSHGNATGGPFASSSVTRPAYSRRRSGSMSWKRSRTRARRPRCSGRWRKRPRRRRSGGACRSGSEEKGACRP